MTDTVEVEAQADVYDAGEGVYRREGDTFEIAESAVGKHGGLLKPTDGPGDGDSADNSGGSDGENTPADEPAESLTDLEGVGDSTADGLRAAGYESVADVRNGDADQLADDVDGIGQSLAESLTGTGE